MSNESKFFRIDQVILMDQKPGENIISVHVTNLFTNEAIHWVLKLSEMPYPYSYSVLMTASMGDLIKASMDDDKLVEIDELYKPDHIAKKRPIT